MTSFAQQYQTGTNSDSMIQTESPCCQRENAPQPDVGADRHDRTLPHCGDDEAFAERLSVATVEAELDRVIAELGDRMMDAMRDADPCYFSAMGELDAKA
jgi:hypothetical protein